MTSALEDRNIGIQGYGTGGEAVRLEPSPKWIRTVFGDTVIADSRRVMLLFEAGHLPVYYFPIADVRMDLLEPTDRHTVCPKKGEASYWSIRVGDRVAENAVWGYPNPIPACPPIGPYVAFYWKQMDSWWEEDDEVFVHARDPYKRVDVLNSSRHVRIELGGEVVADTHRPRLLFETSLPTRYYIPKADVRMDLLVPTSTVTQCPYKGKASYWSFRSGEKEWKDIAWSYQFPIPECPKIEGMICFFNEQVDGIYVDGELQPVPKSPWS